MTRVYIYIRDGERICIHARGRQTKYVTSFNNYRSFSLPFHGFCVTSEVGRRRE